MAAIFPPSSIGYIINTIEDLLITMDSQYPMKIGTVGNFVNICFSLRNGNVEIEIHDDEAFCIYKTHSGEHSKSSKFYQRYLTDAASEESLFQALKQIRDFDRQQASQAQNMNTPIDRASFGLAEVN